MINKLINMEVPSIVNREKLNNSINNYNYSIQDYVTAFINGMGETQRIRFKRMLENGIKCGVSVADNYGIDYDKFIEEVKKQMEVI